MTYYEFKVEIFPINEKSALETWLNELGKEGFRLASLENYFADSKALTKCVMTRSSSEKPKDVSVSKGWQIFPESEDYQLKPF